MRLRHTLAPALALTAALVTPAWTSAHAQPAAGDGRIESGRGSFQVGYLQLDLGDLNQALTAAAYPELDNGFLTLGGAGFGERGRWLIGGEGAAFIGRSRTTTNGDFDVSLNGGYGMFRVGYRAVVEGDLELAPSFGVGAGGTQFSIRGRSAPTFDDILANPARSASLASASLVLGAAIDGHYRIRINSRRGNGQEGGPMLGLSAGYIVAPLTSQWRLDDLNSVAGGPTVRIQGFFVRISIGGWGRSRVSN